MEQAAQGSAGGVKIWGFGKAAGSEFIHVPPTFLGHIRNKLRGEQSVSAGKREAMELTRGEITALENPLHCPAVGYN